ncbi:MAG TPA: SLC13/DASS family transporter [Phycisphaerales bacterium]|nr:SLC13/DASS family transporter [Phycisphaerales bacterium]
MGTSAHTHLTRFRTGSIVAGPVAGSVVYALLGSAELASSPRAVAGIGVWMALWWMTEAVPLAVTSLLPLVLFPLAGVMSLGDASRPFAHPLVVLFMGGFILGLAVERWGLHKRLALSTVLVAGTKPTRLIGGFMLASAMLSMFISNTATTIMMLPIAISVITLLDHLHDDEGGMGRNFASALLLGVAYASSIGGVATITGTQPNLLLVGFLKDHDVDIGWMDWLPLGLVMMAVMLPLTWLVLTRLSLPVRVGEVKGAHAHLRSELDGLGRISRGEWVVIVTFSLVAFGWISRKFVTGQLAGHGFSEAADRVKALGDAGIAMIGAIALFVIPVNPSKREFAMDWQTATKMPWDVLLLFGGGLSLASAMKQSGLDAYIGGHLAGLDGVPAWVLVMLVCLTVIFLTELTSNTATTAAFVPILGSAAPALGVHPALLMVPAGIVASYAFMLPVATPPNAIVFGSGRLSIREMARTGLILNILGVIVVTIILRTIGGWLLGIDLSRFPTQ